MASEALQQVATGNLQIKSIPIKNKDEVGDLVDSFNKMVQDLQDVIGKLKNHPQVWLRAVRNWQQVQNKVHQLQNKYPK